MAPRPRTPLRVPPELDGARLDRALAALVRRLSRARLQELVRDGGVRVDGEVVRRPAHPVEAGQTLELLDVPRSRERRGSPAGAELCVLHADDHVAVVDKPAGMVVHPSTVVHGGTVSELAEALFGPLPTVQGEDRPGIVHRLDADTSGVLVLARTEAAGAELVRQFREREVEKRYLALVHGEPRFDSDWIEVPLGRSERHPDRVSVLPEGEGRPAETFYEVVERLGPASLLSCRPRTGRTHQLRVHLAWLGHAIVGDRLYRPRGRRQRLPPDAPEPGRHALHAARLAFVHPATGAPVAFESPLPADLERLLAWLRTAGPA